MTGTSEARQPPDGNDLFGWIDAAEAHIAEGIDQTFKEEAAIEALAQAWRTGLGGVASLPPELKRLSGAQAVPRGGARVPGGLGGDYPTGLFELVRAGWSATARALAFQQSMLPFGAAQAAELGGLAGTIDAAPMPAFCPTPTQVVLEGPGMRLRRLEPHAGRKGEPILVVSSLINRWYILDFLSGASFLERLAALGRPVYVVEWIPPSGPVDERTLGQLCAGPLREAIDQVRKTHRTAAVALVGYSMGGTLAAIMAARYPARVSRLASLCGPILFAKGGLFTRWFAPRHLDVERVATAYDHVPAALVHLPFWWLRPTIKAKKLVQLGRGFKRKGFVDFFLATEVWNYDNVDVARGVFRGWTGDLFQRDALAKGELEVDGERVRLSEVACPVLAISGSEDHIVPPEAVEALADLCGGAYRIKLRVQGAHHVRVLTSRTALQQEEEAIRAWLAADARPPRRATRAKKAATTKKTAKRPRRRSASQGPA